MEKKHLRRSCCVCGNVYDVYREGDVWDYNYGKGTGHNYVTWTTDPFAEEIHDYHGKMWLCIPCWQDSALDI